MACSHVLLCGLLVGQESRDGSDDLGQVVATAMVAGQGSPVLQVSDAVLDRSSAGGMGVTSCVVIGHQKLHVIEVFAAAFARWSHDLASGLVTQALIAGIGQDLHVPSIGQQL